MHISYNAFKKAFFSLCLTLPFYIAACGDDSDNSTTAIIEDDDDDNLGGETFKDTSITSNQFNSNAVAKPSRTPPSRATSSIPMLASSTSSKAKSWMSKAAIPTKPSNSVRTRGWQRTQTTRFHAAPATTKIPITAKRTDAYTRA